MVENIANKFEKTMKKGFVNIFVLMALKKEPTHGYQIKKLIEERSFGFWTPTDSTMYTILKDMKDKDLIRLSENQDSNDTRKIYELTKKGLEILDLMLKKEEEMRQSMKSIISLITDDDDIAFPPKGMDDFMNGPGKMPFMKGPFRGQFLKRIKNFPIDKIINDLPKNELISIKESVHHILELIDKKILELESESDTKSN